MNSDLPIGIDAVGGDKAENLESYYRVAKAAYSVAWNEPGQKFKIAGSADLIKNQLGKPPSNLEFIEPNDSRGAVRLLAKLLASQEIAGFYTLENTQKLVPAVDLYVRNFEACKYVFSGQRALPLLAELPKSSDAKRTGSWYLLDVGGVTGASVERFMTYARIGCMYASTIGNRQNPAIGLINIGSEDNKGESLDVQVNAELRRLFPKKNNAGSDCKGCFIGNVEPYPCIFDREKGSDEYRPLDVALSDARTGNLIIKWWAAGAEFYAREFRYEASRGKPWEKAGAAMSREVHKRIKSRISKYGVSKFPCLNKPVCKGHGTSGLESITAGILHLMDYIKTDGTGKMRSAVENYAKELARERW